MPRIRQYADKYSYEDFRKEVFRKLADRYCEVSVRKLAAESGLAQSTLNTKLRHKTESLEVEELRKIIPVLRPDPTVVLQLLGYSNQDISRFKKQNNQEE